MFIVWVTIKVLSEHTIAFQAAISENADSSVQLEAGCLQFDVIDLGDSASHHRFALYEIYRDEQSFQIEHKQSAHYVRFQAAVEPLLAAGGLSVTTGTLLVRGAAQPAGGR